MTELPRSVLMVTREMSGDRRYGLGRSLMPVVDALTNKAWRVRYLCQEDLPTASQDKRYRWLARLRRLPGVASRPSVQQVLGALAERMHMGWFAAHVARQEGYTAVHLHDPWLGLGFWLGRKRLGLQGVRWGITEHGFGCYSRATHEDGLVQGPRMQRWLRRLEAFVLRRAHWVTAPTQLALDQLARDLALPFNPPHWHTISHAAPVMTLVDREVACQSLGWSPQDFHVLGVGRLVPLKRFDIVVAACASLAQRYPALHLHLLGDGDRGGLQQLADAAGFGDRIHFAMVDDVQPYYAAANAYVSTSVTESFGLANFEALIAGLPCICTAVGGVPEVMGSGAWLIPVDQGALESALEALVSQPAQRHALAARAVAQARKAPNLESVVEQYVQLFYP
ncbi:glycosyltransferase family 4 protein [Rhodoferax sp. AJA081-3]|uniref:glycosyltransferase family 4 protein n=1 Tax=Rhodoferax sp. AJA081-3 TaxID=2752316 RepID=UPI001ADF71CC|nr:glycosyltransferase family 4 protein [Rhodoferax sp. AJA081-3]QTN26124.1 glycosyltransferase family 4 protein [Rhodoferax sp. AJA081-3]